MTYKEKFNKKYGFKKNASHSLKEISAISGYSLKGLEVIYAKGIGAYKTNPRSVRPSVKSPEQWAYGRVYSAVMGGKAQKIDESHLKKNKKRNMISVRKATTKAKNAPIRYVVTENGKPYRGKSFMDYNVILYFPTKSKANDFAKKLRKFRNLEKTIDKNHKKKIYGK